VLSLILILLLLWAVLAGLLTAWTVWYQGYIYTEPALGLQWRGPAAGTAVTAALLVWVVIDYNSPGNYRPIYEFSSTEDQKPFAELRVPTVGGEEVYKLRSAAGRPGYRLAGRAKGGTLPATPEKVIAVEGDHRYVFEPERDAQGHIKRRTPPWWGLNRQPEPLRYKDEKGRVMLEGQLGQLTTFRAGRLFGNLALNFFFLLAWFLSLWLLLRFGWGAALLQAVIFWGVALLFMLPPVLTRAEEVSKQRAIARGAPREPG
jgi:hypothetical protein